MTTHWSKEIYYACDSAKRWLKTQPDFATTWKNCSRGDWMMYLLGRIRERNEKRMVRAITRYVRQALSLLQDGDEKSVYLSVVRIVMSWSHGQGSSKAIEKSQEEINNLYEKNKGYHERSRNKGKSKSFYVNDALSKIIDFIEESQKREAYKEDLWTAIDDISKIIPPGHGRFWQRARQDSLAVSADIIRSVFPIPPRLSKIEEDYVNY